ncbi:MAG: glycosyl hydrolase, partial [Kiritimatiellales bacterium]
HYGVFRKFCNQHGLGLQAESGHTGSGIKVKGASVDYIMDEFWTHFSPGNDSILFNRNTVFAAHVYGQNRNTWEAFTSHQQWLETPGQLKAMANNAYAMGANHMTEQGFSSSPAKTPPPGDVIFAGTHFNPGVTWWHSFALPLTAFFNRCQTMLTAGLPVTDMLYLDGETLQDMIQTDEMLRESDRRFWKFDAIPGELLAEKASVNTDGRIMLPNGQTYAVLVASDTSIQLNAMRTVARLAEQGATVWFQAVPDHTDHFSDGPDAEIRTLVKRMGADRAPGIYAFGKGRILTGADHSRIRKLGTGVRTRTFYDGMHATAMDQLGVPSAFSCRSENPTNCLYFFQRNAEGADVYFVANPLRTNVQAECMFRVSGRQPERWDPVSGKISDIQTYSVNSNITVIPLEFAPYESFFVVFRKPVAHLSKPEPSAVTQNLAVSGPWEIAFDPARDGLEPFTVKTDSLFRWDLSADRRIADFSGTAVYKTTVEIPADLVKSAKRMVLDLGQPPGLCKLTGMGGGRPYGIDPDVYDALCAEVFINGNPAGVLWCSPYRMDISSLVKAGVNVLEIRVTNTWHNWRLANKFTAGTHPWEKKGLELPPAPAGLLGPVRIETRD